MPELSPQHRLWEGLFSWMLRLPQSGTVQFPISQHRDGVRAARCDLPELVHLLCTPLTPPQCRGSRGLPSLHGQPWGRGASLPSSPIMCSLHVLMLLLPPICPVVEGHLYQIPWLNQIVQMALPLLCVAHLTLPFSCRRACFPLFWVDVRKTQTCTSKSRSQLF